MRALGQVYALNGGAHVGHKQRIGLVDDWRVKPFDQGGIAFFEQAQRLAQLPAVDIEHIRDRQLDHIALLAHAQVPRQARRIDKAHIVVTVGRCKTPAPAAGLAGKQDAHLVLDLDLCQLGFDVGAHGGVDGVHLLLPGFGMVHARSLQNP